AVRDVAVEPGVEAVGGREVGQRPHEQAVVEYHGGGVDELRPGVAGQQGEAAREALLDLGLQRVVARVADVVPGEAHRVEAGEGPKRLGAGDGRLPQRR